jgi:hypothetical protein
MAPVIWGLNLGDMKWSMFGSKWMWHNKDYHLRRTKFVIYQLAMINMVVSESIGTAALTGKFETKTWIKTIANDDKQTTSRNRTE